MGLGSGTVVQQRFDKGVILRKRAVCQHGAAVVCHGVAFGGADLVSVPQADGDGIVHLRRCHRKEELIHTLYIPGRTAGKGIGVGFVGNLDLHLGCVEELGSDRQLEFDPQIAAKTQTPAVHPCQAGDGFCDRVAAAGAGSLLYPLGCQGRRGCYRPSTAAVTGRGQRNVENVIGLTKKEAQSILKNFSVEYSGSGNVIISQSPEAGNRIAGGEVVRLYLG